jgi:endonuclease YncB( thermonuclease family)
METRVNDIDAPETGLAFSQVSRTNLASLVADKDVVVVSSKTDQYGRIIGTVLVGTINANLEQLKGGWAWYYRQYAHRRRAGQPSAL